MDFQDIADVISKELMELGYGAGLIMVGVIAIIWIVGQKRTAKEKVIALIQGILLCVLGPLAFKWLYAGLVGIKSSLVVGGIVLL